MKKQQKAKPTIEEIATEFVDKYAAMIGAGEARRSLICILKRVQSQAQDVSTERREQHREGKVLALNAQVQVLALKADRIERNLNARLDRLEKAVWK